MYKHPNHISDTLCRIWYIHTHTHTHTHTYIHTLYAVQCTAYSVRRTYTSIVTRSSVNLQYIPRLPTCIHVHLHISTLAPSHTRTFTHRTTAQPHTHPHTYRNTTGYNHDIDNVVVEFGKRSRNTWWQSMNGEQTVSIRVDLEAEFHFTHLILNFKSAKPYSLMIERSPDYGVTWKVSRDRSWVSSCILGRIYLGCSHLLIHIISLI